jgi:regulatory protein
MLKRSVKRLGIEQALQKLRHYCSYQERSHLEAKEKLYSFGLYKTEVEACISTLIEEDYLNEERFAMAYARGKFRMKGWGKNKIIQSLKQKGVSVYCIEKALKEVNGENYAGTLNKAAETKWKSLSSEKNVFTKMRKTQNYLLQKGFEFHLIREELLRIRQISDDGR